MPEASEAEENITVYCPKCKLSLAHIVVAREGGRFTEVTCTTCKHRHPYKGASHPPKPRASRAKKGGASPLPVGAGWEARIASARGKEHVYTMTTVYSIGDIVLHEQFGKGVVLKLATNKCYVLFQDKERLMASAN